jgi:hypothetical protein
MSGEPCPVCGHVNGACAGKVKTQTRQIITADGMVTQHGLPRVPSNQRRGWKSGYVGNVQIFDPRFPNVRLVSEPDEVVEEDADEPVELTFNEGGASAGSGAGVVLGDPAPAPKPPRTRKPKVEADA